MAWNDDFAAGYNWAVINLEASSEPTPANDHKIRTAFVTLLDHANSDGPDAAKLREVMRERKISVNALSKATGLTRQTIMRSIEGTRSLDMRQFDKIAQAIGIPHEDLIRDIRAA